MTTENANVNATVNFGALLEQAIRNKIRFDTPKGQATVEDLFDLPLTSTSVAVPNLDAIAVGLDAQLRANNDKVVSFVKPAPKKKDFTQLKFDIVQYILNEKMAERDAAASAREVAEHNQKILALIEQKQNDALGNMDIDELKKLLKPTGGAAQ